MEVTKLQAIDYPRQRYSATISGIVNTTEWLIIALILALVFRAFVMEAFRIPTGSMAETLNGSHYYLGCTRCGYRYNVGGDSLASSPYYCPSCGYLLPCQTPVLLENGDRIFVLKCIYQFADPKRWDVVVFKNPVDPHENYIKRMIALPGERVEIIDGDIYINDKIVSKPAKVQQELWMPIYNNDYQPFGRAVPPSASPLIPRGAAGTGDTGWKQPFENQGSSQWDLNADDSTVFALDSNPGTIDTIAYNTSTGNDFRAKYAYNDSNGHHFRPVCSDLMARFYVIALRAQGLTGVGLGKYGIEYKGWVDFTGRMVIEKSTGTETITLAQRQIEPPETGRAVEFQFANVDHRLMLRFGDENLVYNLAPDTDGDVDSDIAPQVKIFGAGKLKLLHVGVYRDTYYIGDGLLRAEAGEPFTLGDDEFFVCGDNSPSSFDSRMWSTVGIGDNGTEYTVGTVPRDYLVGKAVVRYWSDAFKPFENFLPIIPNFGQMKRIFGGNDDQ